MDLFSAAAVVGWFFGVSMVAAGVFLGIVATWIVKRIFN